MSDWEEDQYDEDEEATKAQPSKPEVTPGSDSAILLSILERNGWDFDELLDHVSEAGLTIPQLIEAERKFEGNKTTAQKTDHPILKHPEVAEAQTLQQEAERSSPFSGLSDEDLNREILEARTEVNRANQAYQASNKLASEGQLLKLRLEAAVSTLAELLPEQELREKRVPRVGAFELNLEDFKPRESEAPAEPVAVKRSWINARLPRASIER